MRPISLTLLLRRLSKHHHSVLPLFLSVGYGITASFMMMEGNLLPVHWSSIEKLLAVFVGLMSTLSLGASISFLFGRLHLVRRFLGSAVIAFLLLLAYYRIERDGGVDLNLLVSNFGIATQKGSLLVLSSLFGLKRAVLFGLLVIGYPLADWKATSSIYKKRSLDQAGFGKRPLLAVVWLLIYGGIALAGVPTMDETSKLLRQVVEYYEPDIEVESHAGPDVKSTIGAGLPRVLPFEPYENSPNIVVLMIESFNYRYPEMKGPDGEWLMPNFRRLSQKGWVATRYYANSIQTARGQFAALQSQVPSYRKKSFVSHADNELPTLAEVLSDRGYETAFVKAYSDIEFDNSGTFLEQNGFRYTLSLYDYLSDKAAADVWGWGPEDDVLYRHIPDILDTVRQEPGVPLFLVLHTVMNHMYFDQVPADKQLVYPNPIGLREHYANSIALVDRQLARFEEELKASGLWEETIIVITGDHGITLGYHGIESVELDYHEDVFRTPFLLIALGKLEPYVDAERPLSHVDLAPTLLDLLGVRDLTNTFVGVSMLRVVPDLRLTPLVQLYNGVYLGSVRGQWKYLHHLETGDRFVYDLHSDPMERTPLETSVLPERATARFEEDIRVIMRRQQLLENDRLGVRIREERTAK